jgi:hypothetical protein
VADRPLPGPQNIAIGFTADPVAPGTASGAQVRTNSFADGGHRGADGPLLVGGLAALASLSLGLGGLAALLAAIGVTVAGTAAIRARG